MFSQVMGFASNYPLLQCIKKYQGDHRVRSLTCREQFRALAFGQLAHRESLRDVVACLGAHREKLYHLGFGGPLSKTTLAKANELRDWRMYRDFAQILIDEARQLYASDAVFDLALDGTYYAIDSTSIDLCLSLFGWAPYKEAQGAVKVHTQMDLRGSIPTFFHITDGKVNDMNFLDLVSFERGAHYIMDRGYVDYARLHTINQAGAYFVTRAKKNMLWERIYSQDVDRRSGLRCDQIIRLTGVHAHDRYPDKLRRVKYYDAETDQLYVFLTNDFSSSAQTIADLYRHRWQIELFFRWIKQHLKIKVFWGRSENAVKTQICVAICTYLIVAIMKKRLDITCDLNEMLQILSVSLFDKMPVVELFSGGALQKDVKGFQSTLPGLGF